MSCDNIPKAQDISGGFIYVNRKGFEHVSQENSATFKTKKKNFPDFFARRNRCRATKPGGFYAFFS